MRWAVLVSVLLGWTMATARPAAADEVPTVRAVMFWDKSCPNCEAVLNDILPPIEARFGGRFKLVLAEVSSVEASDKYFAAIDHFQLPQERQGVPMLVIGDQVLLGREEIAQRLAAEIERGLAAGGVDYPPALALTPADIAALDRYSRAAWTTAHPTDPVANALALTVLAFMLVAVVAALVLVWRAWRRATALDAPVTSARVSVWVAILALAGLAVAGYLSYVKLTGSDTVCPIGRCEAVQHSAYATLAGVPVSVLGLLTYAAILVLWLWSRMGGGRTATLLLAGVSLFGTVFSAYLTYLEPFVIQAVCVWCLASAILITVIMLLSVRAAVAGAAGAGGAPATVPA
jgi:uncharacterized membrane protein